MALLVKMGTSVLVFAALVVAMAFVFSSCSAAGHCSPVVPCNATTCFEYCQKNNYKNFQTSCTPGKYYPICCCQVRGGGAAAAALPSTKRRGSPSVSAPAPGGNY